jgi:hypothetical protein
MNERHHVRVARMRIESNSFYTCKTASYLEFLLSIDFVQRRSPTALHISAQTKLDQSRVMQLHGRVAADERFEASNCLLET